MNIVSLSQELIPAFLAYCAQYGSEHDESYLPGDRFAVNADNPTALLLDERGRLSGVASLMLEKAYRAIRKGRFRILHAVEPSLEAYRSLLMAILPTARSVDEVYLFLPESRRNTIGLILEDLGFAVERYSWYLRRSTAGMPGAEFPPGFVLRPIRRGIDEPAWAAVINVAFSDLKGHVESTVDRVLEMYDEPGHRDDGMLALWHDDEMVGTMRVSVEESDGMMEASVGGLAVLPNYQNRGLGRNMLRAAVALGRCWGLERAGLSVNAENERAASLYLEEGFEQVELYICYSLAVPSASAHRGPSRVSGVTAPCQD